MLLPIMYVCMHARVRTYVLFRREEEDVFGAVYLAQDVVERVLMARTL
jgi:hypothetical protein